LNSVAVGGIELYDVEAVVNLNKEFPEEILLGMSFLGRLEMQHSSSQLILRKKF
jgi:predicted aspartyl protease